MFWLPSCKVYSAFRGNAIDLGSYFSRLSAMTKTKKCPCNPAVLYKDCCEAVLTNPEKAVTAEMLMRSRYSAYVIGDTTYLLKTWHTSTRPSTINLKSNPDWCGLQIFRTEKGQRDDVEGIVEFEAIALSQGNILKLHEISRFVKENNRWLYLSGEIINMAPSIGHTTGKTGRNEPCPCGSGKKFKKCCAL